MKKYLLLLCIAATAGNHANAQVATLTNNTGYGATVVLSGTDDAYFGFPGAYVQSNPIPVGAFGWLGTDVNTTTNTWGWAVVPGAGYPAFVAIQTIVWKDAKITLSGSSCGTTSGGASNPGCGVSGFPNPYYFCPGFEHVTWLGATCLNGANVSITINP